MTDITLLIHGPVSPYTEKVVADACAALQKGQVARAIYAGYVDDLPKIEKQVTASFADVADRFTLVGADDVRNPGIANVNRQVNLVNTGLARIGQTDIIIKLRSDQRVSFSKCIKVIDAFEAEWRGGKLLTTNCYTRTDRLYHPSDMFLMGTPETLRSYYPTTLFPQTFLDDMLAIRQDCMQGLPLGHMPQWPEARLFRHFLTQRGWKFKETQQDSFDALRAHTIILDARQVWLRWEKFYAGWVPLVPYRFTMEAFPDLPPEHCACVSAADFGGCSSKMSARTDWLTKWLWHPAYVDFRSHGDWKRARRLLWQ